MSTYSRSHLSDSALQHDLVKVLRDERSATALVLADLAEFDARKLYVPAGYPSMFAYCVDGLGFSEDAFYKRIQAARAARKFPALFEAVARGRLNLTAVNLMAPYLTIENAEELIDAASGMRKSAIQVLIAERFPSSEVLPMVVAAPGSAAVHEEQLAPAQVGRHSTETAAGVPNARSTVRPVAAQRFALQIMIDQSTHDKLQEAQELLGHRIPPGDLGQVLDRALDALLRTLRQRKCGTADRPSTGKRHVSFNPRFVPREVRRAVWARDGGRCTFVSENGHHCEERVGLELDHIDPVARGGRATIDGMRLRCRAHNQFEAEKVFGAGFMEEKRDLARRCGVLERAAREHAAAASTAEAADTEGTATAPSSMVDAAREAARRRKAAEEVIPYLRHFRFSLNEARRLAALCEAIPDAPLEERIRLALASYGRARFRGLMNPAGMEGTSATGGYEGATA